MKKQTKWMAVLSTAVMMAAVTPAFTAPVMAQTAGWTEEDGTWKYYDADGYYLTDTWKKQGGEWFYLDEEGYLAFDSQIDEYYVGSDGKRVTNQWVSVANESDWDTPDAPENYWFYYGKDGKAVTSRWQVIEDKWYYFDSDSHMATGKVEIDGSTYYLGDSTDGVMKTGWVQLEDNTDDPDESIAWYYFDRNGKMVENQVDKKIDGSYYTFVDGKMQTGWYKLPDAEPATATASDAESTQTASVKGFQFYDKETGRRADGWMTIEGAPGISTPDETYNFYFKNGKPFHAETGIQVFTISSNKYGFNTKGEMQTGLKVVTLENGETAHFLFHTDGVMKTGKQTVYNEDLDQNQTWFIYTDGSRKGQGFHGFRDNAIYEYGLRKDADADVRFAPVSFQDNQYLVNTSGIIQKATSSAKSSEKPELGAGHKDVKDANGKVWVVDVNGIIK
ncbi:MAG: cell wall-binding protein [Hungatella hathewayi]